ncbi:hydroxyethylthiazole kinase [Acinetobacter rathckeae]|uniref:hydroxyethylthiazole kinase n=1 Tax=Acinetobacter rathckeae TaxID=2605272 RepID=UPI0018A33311|nr:hydroxyethylthiazole kinase [Acinetobacter rathckeae]MBF7687136.1 hydroxyethylthiazole kinase [Acinetobacter rathckeae]MBF7694512.1 hydroxyethylthiazole kinase [Acinetobacter rathckeae]
MTTINDLKKQVIHAWSELQQQTPLVQCITNTVAANYVANTLLACGASPAMVDNPYEAESFTRVSSALSINLGTPTSEQMQSIKISAATAHQQSVPWVLDPVGYSSILKWRSEMTQSLLNFTPSVIRGNASEIACLTGDETTAKGVDSTQNSADTYHSATALLKFTSCVAISGEVDFIVSNDLPHIVKVSGGSALQPKVTATGCALGALIAAYCAVAPVAIATIAAHVHFAIAGQLAAQKSQSIGSFNVAFLDELHTLNTTKLEQYMQIDFV